LPFWAKRVISLDTSKYIRRKQTPSIKQMLTMLEPKTFPIDTPTFSGFNTAKMATKSSGKDVEKGN